MPLPVEGSLHQCYGSRPLLRYNRFRDCYAADQYGFRFSGQSVHPVVQGQQSREWGWSTVPEVLQVDKDDELRDHRGRDLDEVGGGVGVDPHQPQERCQECGRGEVCVEAALGEHAHLVDTDHGANDEERYECEQETKGNAMEIEQSESRGQRPVEQRNQRGYQQEFVEEVNPENAKCRMRAHPNEIEIEDSGALI